MYGGSQGVAVASVLTTAGTVSALPTTGAGTVTSLAVAAAAGLLTWGAVYYYKTVRG